MFNFPPEISGKLKSKAEEMLHDKLAALGLNPKTCIQRVTVKNFDDFENYWEWILDKEKSNETYLFSMYLDIISTSNDGNFYIQQHLFDIQMTMENKDMILNGFKQGNETRMSSINRLKNKW